MVIMGMVSDLWACSAIDLLAQSFFARDFWKILMVSKQILVHHHVLST